MIWAQRPAVQSNVGADRIMSAFADYRAAIAADIAIVKTLAETNTAALASAGLGRFPRFEVGV